MYTTIETGRTSTASLPQLSGTGRAFFGRMAKTASAIRHSATVREHLCGYYFSLSLMGLCVWSETSFWPNLLNMVNFANSVRLANKTAKRRTAAAGSR